MFRPLLLSVFATLLMSTTACAQETPNIETSHQEASQTEAVVKVAESTATPSSVSAEDETEQSTHSADDGHGHEHAQEQMIDPSTVDFIFDEAPDDHVMGSDSAPNTVIAYASVTCPHCSDWFINQWPTFKKEQIDTGKVRFILREFPTAPQNVAMGGFILANCAPKEKYWDHVIYQFQKQKEIFEKFQTGKGNEVIDKYAEMADLKDSEAVDACFNEQAHIEQIQRAVNRAVAGGISGVPAFYINGEKLEKGGETAAGLAAKITGLTEKGTSK